MTTSRARSRSNRNTNGNRESQEDEPLRKTALAIKPLNVFR